MNHYEEDPLFVSWIDKQFQMIPLKGIQMSSPPDMRITSDEYLRLVRKSDELQEEMKDISIELSMLKDVIAKSIPDKDGIRTVKLDSVDVSLLVDAIDKLNGEG